MDRPRRTRPARRSAVISQCRRSEVTAAAPGRRRACGAAPALFLAGPSAGLSAAGEPEPAVAGIRMTVIPVGGRPGDGRPGRWAARSAGPIGGPDRRAQSVGRNVAGTDDEDYPSSLTGGPRRGSGMDFLTFAKHCHKRSQTPGPGLWPLGVGEAVEDRVPVRPVQALEERAGAVVAGERAGEVLRYGPGGRRAA